MLNALTTNDWQRATPCPGWDVLGLVNHLIGDDLSVIAWQRDGHHGTPAPAGGDEASFVEWLDELQIEWVHAARRISPRLAVELLEWLGGAVADTFQAQPVESMSARVSWASDEVVPVWLDQARKVTERWIHRQQLREAVGRSSDLAEDLAGRVLDSLRWAYPYRLDALGTSAGVVRIEVSEPFDRHWILTPEAGTFVFAGDDVEVGPASAVLSMSVDQAWRLLTNNYDPNAHGALHSEGDRRAIDVLLRTRAIIGTPKTQLDGN